MHTPPIAPASSPAFFSAVLRRRKAALLLLLAALVLSGCAKPPVPVRAAEPTPEELRNEADPSSLGLTPEAEHLYYYLLFSDALNSNNQDLIAFALQGLLKLEPSLPMYQDSASVLLAKGDARSAKKAAEEGLKHFPDDSMLTLLLAGAENGMGNSAEAVSLLETRLKKHPKDNDAIQELIRIYIKMGEREKASALLARLPARTASPASSLFRAKALASTGKLEEARTLLRSLVAKNPVYAEAWIDLGIMAERSGRPDEAVDAYKKAANLAPDNTELWFRAVSLQLDQGKPEDAMRTLSLAPPAPALLMQAALRFADAGHYSQAEQLLETARANGAGADEVALHLSIVRYAATKDPAKSAEPLKDIGPSSPLFVAAIQRKAQLLMQAGDMDEARKQVKAAREAKPDATDLWTLEAAVLTGAGKAGEAETLLRKGLAEYPGDEEILYALGGLLEEQGRRKEAMETMESIIAANPRNANALNYVGYTLADENRELPRALDLISRALEEKPDADYITDSLAWVQFRLGRYKEAWTSIQRCIALGGDDPSIWEHYAEIALSLDKKGEAITGYTNALRYSPKNSAELQKKLDALK